MAVMNQMLFCSLALIIFSIFFLQKYLQNYIKKKKLPPSPPSLPIIGHLHLLKTPKHRSLQRISNKYGPIVYLNLGVRPTLLVSSPSIAAECFTKNDIIFANRPYTLAVKYFSYENTEFAVSPYGDHWRNIRRVMTIHIFSSVNLNRFSTIRMEETRFLVIKLLAISSDESCKAVNMKSLFSELVLNVVMKMVAGKKWDESSDTASLLASDIPMSIFDYFPILVWFDFWGYERNLVGFQRKLDKFLQDLIDESRRNGNCSISSDDQKNKPIIQSLLSLQEAEPEYYTDDIIKGILMDVFVAGNETVAYTMEWVMSLLLNHPDVLEKVRSEIHDNIGPGHLVQDSDLPKLSYLRCVINETLRLIPLVPLFLPHFSSEDCVINGYNVPRGTTLLVNVWAIHRDPNVWEEPLKFKPERFEGIRVEDEKFKFMPFGMGRRACPGSAMGMRFVGLVLGTLIQCFEWKRVGPELVDLEEGDVLVLPKVQPLEALCRPHPCMSYLTSQL